MSTYVFMKILESLPGRYDRGVRVLALGRLDPAYDRLVRPVKPGHKVLDIGCGTGALALRAARKGARVKGIDTNPRLLDIARERAAAEKLTDRLELREMGAGELGGEDGESYDAVMSGLCLSELTDDELEYVLQQAYRILKPGGRLLVADEVRPPGGWKLLVHHLVRIPLSVITWTLARGTTRALKDLPEKVGKAGFQVESVRVNGAGNFMELAARKPGAERR